MASKSQVTYNKKQREKEKALKRKIKDEKRLSKKDTINKGLEINWEIAPKNRTLTQTERESKEANRLNHINI
ncbi:hypothetical protein [Pseudofulvibacter geojedonensis]|uniref:Uncharacterized protein n=1 Tax=Pseudofulvibacter geojedonensis TaxID=1123758 RepID=A0ABW3I4G6_9FLAO